MRKATVSTFILALAVVACGDAAETSDDKMPDSSTGSAPAPSVTPPDPTGDEDSNVSPAGGSVPPQTSVGGISEIVTSTTGLVVTTATPPPPSSTTTATTTTTVSRRNQTVQFDEAIPPKQWGDADFLVSATASSGLPVTYSGQGPCTVTSAGTVSIDGVGTCTVTALQDGDGSWNGVSARADVVISPARVTIEFGDRSQQFRRGLTLPLWATAVPAVPLVYTTFSGPDTVNEGPCRIEGSTFRFVTEPAPTLYAVCGIEVRVRDTSPNYVAPPPERALVRIDFPRWDVDVIPVGQEVSYRSLPGGVLRIRIREGSGQAYGIWATVGGSGCSYGPDGTGGQATPGYPAPAGTNEYVVELTVHDPGSGERLPCTVSAMAQPMDHAGGTSEDAVSFDVVP